LIEPTAPADQAVPRRSTTRTATGAEENAKPAIQHSEKPSFDQRGFELHSFFETSLLAQADEVIGIDDFRVWHQTDMAGPYDVRS
jgi:hypothetical protein